MTYYRYYMLQRPPAPGAYPKPQGNSVIAAADFDGKTEIDSLGCYAWGYVDYSEPVSPYLLQRYDMAASGEVPDPCKDCEIMRDNILREAVADEREDDDEEIGYDYKNI